MVQSNSRKHTQHLKKEKKMRLCCTILDTICFVCFFVKKIKMYIYINTCVCIWTKKPPFSFNYSQFRFNIVGSLENSM